MKVTQDTFPLSIKIGFKKLFDSYRSHLDSSNVFVKRRAEEILKIADEYPVLSEGISTQAEIETYQGQLDLILEDLFSSILENNEIKIATVPYQELIFKSSKRYQTIMDGTLRDFNLGLSDFSNDDFYIMGCSMVLGMYYGKKVDFRRPFYYSIPDSNGIMKHYRVLYNGDFCTIEKGPNSVEITDEDVAELIDNFDNIDLWKEKFPPNSWIFNGFVIANLYDATTDVSLSQFKTNLIQKETKDEGFAEEFETIMQSIFNQPDLKIGYTIANLDNGTLEKVPMTGEVHSYILNESSSGACGTALCERSYYQLFEKKDYYCVSDVEKFYALYPKNVLYRTLHKQKIQSAIITAIVIEDKVEGILEIVSPHKHDLNSINAHKLNDIIPYLIDSVKRNLEKIDNEMELLIQSECTSIHPSVYWKFKKEAERVVKTQMDGETASFREIVFKNVYPLYGQIDIKGSSVARNVATKKDLVLQLELVQKIIKEIFQMEPMPIYEQMEFRIKQFLDDLDQNFKVDSERQILRFLKNEIVPLYDHVSGKDQNLKELIDTYHSSIDEGTGFVYRHRKDYDESVMLINKTMANILDRKQESAQQMYPHFYERFKTDGVEHNLYIGESITKADSFNKIYLYNLRLWQLQAMCEMENSFYQLKETLSVPLDVASMVLVFNSSLSLRFRLDEKRFDVDGTYNARYEVVKKRVDKANIKGTDERVTQPGKIAIIYSQKSDELEFLKYISFLQHKKLLDEEVEIVDLEDLQGVTGLKAIRINVLYNRGEAKKKYYTYEDLMKEIN